MCIRDRFYTNRRILPFREDPTPYHVWLSEIMLQQTRVSAALPYYCLLYTSYRGFVRQSIT